MSALNIFLLASSFSSFGDSLLLFALPAGVAQQFGDIRWAALIYFVPAIVIYFTTFLERSVTARIQHARRDYVVLLVGVGIIEIGFAALVQTSPRPVVVLGSAAGFILLYALIKEGVPRLLQVVSVYRYFVRPEQYVRVAGRHHALSVLAQTMGVFSAGALLSGSRWPVALAIDAATFLLLAAALHFAGRDPAEGTHNDAAASEPADIGLLRIIMFSAAFLPTVNAAVANYIPIIASQTNLGELGSMTWLLGALRAPGMLCGFFLPRILRAVPHRTLLLGIPAINCATSVLFLLYPSMLGFCLLGIVQGAVYGVYWPADYAVRARLKADRLVAFNAQCLRRIAVFQFISSGALLAGLNPIRSPGTVILMIAALGVANALLPTRATAGERCV